MSANAIDIAIALASVWIALELLQRFLRMATPAGEPSPEATLGSLQTFNQPVAPACAPVRLPHHPVASFESTKSAAPPSKTPPLSRPNARTADQQDKQYIEQTFRTSAGHDEDRTVYVDNDDDYERDCESGWQENAIRHLEGD